MKIHSKKYIKGFTLIELLVVISIIGMLSSVVLVALNGARDKGAVGSGLTFATYNYHAFGADAVVVYNFDESSASALDLSGNNYTGTAYNCLSSPYCRTTNNNTPTGSGKSLSLTGSQYVYNNTINLPGGALNEITVSAWINPDATTLSDTNGIPYLILSTANAVGSVNSARTVYMHLKNGGVYFSYNDGASPCSSSNPAFLLQAGKWQNLTFTVKGSPATVKAYLNGKLMPINMGGCTTQLVANIKTILIGASGGVAYYKGYIDDVAVYKQSLSANQAQQLYAAGLPTHTVAVK